LDNQEDRKREICPTYQRRLAGPKGRSEVGTESSRTWRKEKKLLAVHQVEDKSGPVRGISIREESLPPMSRSESTRVIISGKKEIYAQVLYRIESRVSLK